MSQVLEGKRVQNDMFRDAVNVTNQRKATLSITSRQASSSEVWLAPH